jgi:hypothetical protein
MLDFWPDLHLLYVTARSDASGGVLQARIGVGTRPGPCCSAFMALHGKPNIRLALHLHALLPCTPACTLFMCPSSVNPRGCAAGGLQKIQ